MNLFYYNVNYEEYFSFMLSPYLLNKYFCKLKKYEFI